MSVVNSSTIFDEGEDEFRTMAPVRIITDEYLYKCSQAARDDLNRLSDPKKRAANETRSRILFITFYEQPSGSEAFNFASWVGEQEYPEICSLYEIFSSKPDGFRHDEFCRGAEVLAQTVSQQLREMLELSEGNRTLRQVRQSERFLSCFISYSSNDQEFAERLYTDLRASGVPCWFAPEDLRIGEPFRDKIDESIKLQDKLLIILSDHSVQSPWVASEVESAFEREHRHPGRLVLFPIRLDDAVMNTNQAWSAEIRRRRHIGDFSGWKDQDCYLKALKRLLRDLKSEAASDLT